MNTYCYFLLLLICICTIKSETMLQPVSVIFGLVACYTLLLFIEKPKGWPKFSILPAGLIVGLIIISLDKCVGNQLLLDAEFTLMGTAAASVIFLSVEK